MDFEDENYYEEDFSLAFEEGNPDGEDYEGPEEAEVTDLVRTNF